MHFPTKSNASALAPIIVWLTGRVAFHTDQPPSDVDPDIPLTELGIASVSAVSLCGEIEDQWELELDPTVVFDYPTVAEMAVFIAGEVDFADRNAS
ncbi:acyl carrier protein [Rhodococcus jostii]|uniref:Phosphopantetheine attachment site n=1 Tax=Rhodococcus jostii TaxID=132919 RepID=A0A1H5MBK6_RHOJO|nr:acyl carrier protein [Rhodococcus jostii]SEE86675.1 Phosphopantetheine attachment site [Rhodococcus jostii]